MKNFRFSIFIISLFLSSTLFSQVFEYSIEGRVTEKTTGKGVPGANVFISETVWGTSTDMNGNYEIKNIPSGSHEIVVSIIGFAVESKNILLKGAKDVILDFELTEIAYELETVEVVSERPENWDNNLAIFKTYFMGQGEFINDCTIMNEEQLSFSEGANNELYAEADMPLKVLNNALGYEISIVLVSFKWDPKQGRVQYSIKPRFIELEAENEELKNKWIKNRERAYLGSINHFFRSLKDGTFADKGYTLYLVPRLNRNPQFIAKLADPIERSEQLLKRGTFPGDDILDFGDRLNVEYSPIASELKVSYMDLNYREITIDRFGYPEEYMAFQTIGYWAQLGVADWLPKYYGTNEITQ